ncbi:MAG: hypothetical protein ACQETD_06495 [Pseudomonadota bacterium]
MRFFSATSLAMLAALGLSSPAAAQQLQMPAEEATTQTDRAAVEMPVKGMPMEQVRQRYGQPLEVKPAVGDPPITRWVYDDYTVYFEYSSVIHSVPHR